MKVLMCFGWPKPVKQMVTTLYTELVWTHAPASWLIKMCISVLLSTLGSPTTRDPQPEGLGMLPLHGTVQRPNQQLEEQNQFISERAHKRATTTGKTSTIRIKFSSAFLSIFQTRHYSKITEANYRTI